MRRMRIGLVLLLGMLVVQTLWAQSFSVEVDQTHLIGAIGSDLKCTFNLKNLSSQSETLFVVKNNRLPEDWFSYFCVTSCYPSWMDSIVLPNITPGQTVSVYLHVFLAQSGDSGEVHVRIGNISIPSEEKRFVISVKSNVTGIQTVEKRVPPERFFLASNYPNPFNPGTTIRFQLPVTTNVRLEIYDSSGRRVRTLVYKWMPAGIHELKWDGRDDQGKKVPSGIYICGLTAGKFRAFRKMMLIR